MNCAHLNGTYTLEKALSREGRIELLNRIRQTQQQLAELRTALKNESQFNRKVQLNVQIKKLTQELEHDTAKV